MEGKCAKCGTVGDVFSCKYCGEALCRNDYDQHMLWEKRHEGLEPPVKREDLRRRGRR